MLLPACSGLGVALLVTARLALLASPTMVVTLAELLVSVGSSVPELIEAVSVICVWFVVAALT